MKQDTDNARDRDKRIRDFRRAVSSSLGPLRHRPLIAGVSGGADSVALLITLCHLGVDVIVSHCDFHLRGDESERDRVFVEDLCSSLGVTLDTVHFNVEEYIARHPGVSVEMACRELRYAHWRKMLDATGADRIVLAHNADDRIETLLLNLFRGCGSKGLSGMPEVTDIAIRPMSRISRKEILQYLDDTGQTYVTDSSNLETAYRRNFIRNTLLPAIEERWPGVRTALTTTADIMTEENALIRSILDNTVGQGATFLPLDSMTACAAPVTLIRHFLRDTNPPHTMPKEIADCALGGRLAGRQWFTSSHMIDGERDGLHIRPIPTSSGINDESALPEISWTRLPADDETMRAVRSNRDNDKIYMSCFPEHVTLRHPRKGDRIRPLGLNGSRLVSDVLKDARLSRHQKENTLLLEDMSTGHIIWIKGVCRSSHHLITRETEYIWVGEIKNRTFLP